MSYGTRAGSPPVRTGGGRTQQLDPSIIEAVELSLEDGWIELFKFDSKAEVDSVRNKVKLYCKNHGYDIKTSIKLEPEITLNIHVTDPSVPEIDDVEETEEADEEIE